MKKGKILILITFLLIGSIGMRKLDINLRYNMGMCDYYKYNTTLTEKEKDLLQEKHFLVGVYNDPPLAFINKFNNYNAGIMVDYLSQLAIELSSNIHLKVGSQDYLMKAMKNDEVDIMVMENTDENKKEFDISQSLCVVKGKIFVKNNSNIKDIEDIKDRTLVVLERDNEDGRINKYFKDKINVKIFEVDNIYQCFALIKTHTVDGFVGDDMEIAHFLNVTNRGTNFRVLEPTLYEKEMCLAVKKENGYLLDILNKGILQLKKKNLIAQTQYKWLGNFDTDVIDLSSIELAYKVLLAGISIIVIFSSWNYLITQRVNTKTRELSESKEELRLIIDTMKNGIMVIEGDSIIVECNDAITGITNIPREDLIGSNYKEFKALYPFVNIDNMNKLFNVGNSYYYVTSQKIASNKSMIIIEDYTKKYFNEKRARQESKMIAVGQLSAGLAHEIRNPLGLIKSYSYIIEKHSINELCDHAIVVINDSVARINKLVENLLRFSKLSNDETKSVNIENLLNLILELEEKNIEQNGIKIITSFTGKSSKQVFINEDVLRMLLLNLINNSIDSFKGVAREEKKIDIRMNIEEDYLRIEVMDNGCGIEKKKLENIFNPFYSTKENGTGLGLYIISTEISNNDGRISVESNLGEGTKFDIILPIKEIKE
ncbi:ATP-binding protein [Crassaminicella profunda]|uniref:ATP-binding protein n=1 Tax=Crassaminicella profunda TaxID=1286698 RepID=UPI001CA6EB62|nr:transporter substrate-binding domain-containing protein [Crassaminicella profunda]QZY55171.1 transporter substrate-binding domain-containing protein [Crassaminicella profunda]